ncbi:leucine-rich repeat domain-containing protein [Flavobacterium sp. F-328]|uniref:Leucine-rich repeat domain-containing protein n=1 Tax=Flavobacterium erciyesense TaxID=2825842 RepID=A0ABS5D6T8_9FLAO|nr:leucine-rich repeat domain-containing protein [Flavobacterium erciyesense]MBQ0909756.1 leucine-rich repeat domain-containing protein [Flavobacterium erciyesense]
MEIKELSILTSEKLKYELIKSDLELDDSDLILDSVMYERTVPPNKLFLIDMEEKVVIREFNEDDDYNTIFDKRLDGVEILKFGFFDLSKFLPFFTKVKVFAIHGDFIDLMLFSADENARELLTKIKFKLLFSRFANSIKERLNLESELLDLYKEIYNLPYDALPQSTIDFINNNKSRVLELGWLPLSNKDLENLLRLNKVEELYLLYNFRNSFKRFSKTLKVLSVRFNFIININEIYLDLPKLINLDLSGNSIFSPINFNIFPKKIECIDLSSNFIDDLSLDNSPPKLEDLILKNNQLTNESFIISQANYSLKFLDLRNNQIIINLEFLEFIDKFFPNLTNIYLDGNHSDNYIQQLFEGDDQLESIKVLLAEAEFGYEESIENIRDKINLYNNKNFIKVLWKSNRLPLDIIIREIQFRLYDYLEKLETKIYLNEGVYCDFQSCMTSMLIYKNDEDHSISFELYSNSLNFFIDYFFKYLDFLKIVIEDVTSNRLIPYFTSSNKLNYLKDYFRIIYKVQHKVKKHYYLNIDNDKEFLISDHKQLLKPIYMPLRDVLFVVLSSKKAYSFCKNDNNCKIYNKIKVNETLFNTELTIRGGVDKQNIKEILNNVYLNENRFIEIDLYIDDNIGKKVSLLVNTNHIKVEDENYTKVYLNKNFEFDNLLLNNSLGTYKIEIEKNEIRLVSNI